MSHFSYQPYASLSVTEACWLFNYQYPASHYEVWPGANQSNKMKRVLMLWHLYRKANAPISSDHRQPYRMSISANRRKYHMRRQFLETGVVACTPQAVYDFDGEEISMRLWGSIWAVASDFCHAVKRCDGLSFHYYGDAGDIPLFCMREMMMCLIIAILILRMPTPAPIHRRYYHNISWLGAGDIVTSASRYQSAIEKLSTLLGRAILKAGEQLFAL